MKSLSFSGWIAVQSGDNLVRKVLKKYELHRVEGLFDDAYSCISANC